ncbi:MAG: DUF4295 domain-containing protein [Bacteroidetes bacterium]|nr:MAG: DUF4295 domain-containing protein [Bacteroidota bacterium]
MAKKVVATLRKEGAGKEWTRVIKAVRSPKSGSYTFKEEMLPAEAAKDAFKA